MTTFSFRVEGQPPSVNHMYSLQRNRRTGMPFVAKAAGVEAYQLVVTNRCQRAKPADWKPSPQLRITYNFHVKRDIDCDNTLKAINDAIALALNVNDKTFLPCVSSKLTGVKEPFTDITIGTIDADPTDRGLS